MATVFVTLKNWNDPSFWSNLTVANGSTLDMSALGADFTLDFDAGTNRFVIDDGATTFSVGGASTSGTDAILASGEAHSFDVVIAPDGANALTLVGDDHDYSGGSGSDVVDGGGGHDTLYGGAGRDTLVGGDGDDLIEGGAGGAAGKTPLINLNFEDGASGTASDDAANGLDGIYQNGAAAGGTGWDGSGTGVVLDGTNQYVEIPDDPAFQLANGTISIRFNAADIAADGNDALFSRDSSSFDGGGHVRAVVAGDGSVSVRIQDTSKSYTLNSGPGQITDGQWHHVALSFGDKGLTLYIDGEVADASSYTGGIAGNTEPWTLGADQQSSGDGVANALINHFNGQLDEFAVFDTQLTNDEVKTLAKGGVGDIESLVTSGDLLQGDAGADTLIGGEGDDSLTGGEGADFLKSGDGQDTLEGGGGNDTLMNAAGDDSLVGGAGDDLIVATQGDDTLEGGAGFDTLMGGVDNDSLDGGDDDDLLIGDLAGVEFNATGKDGVGVASGISDFPSTELTVELTFSSTVTTDFPTLFSYATPTEDDAFRINAQSGSIHVEIGGDLYDTGVPEAGLFDGDVHTLAVTWDSATGALDVFVDGVNAHSGTLQAGATIDPGGTIVLAQDQDVEGGGYDAPQDFHGTIYGVRLYDDIRSPSELTETVKAPVADTSDANLVANWVADPDTATFTDQTGSHTMVLSGDVQTAWSSGNDQLTGGDGHDTLYGGGGDDTITAGYGDDVVEGGDGDDVISTSFGDDSILGGDGNDSISAGYGEDTIYAGAGDDTVWASRSDFDFIDAGDGSDLIYVVSDFGSDTIYGGEGGSDVDTLDFYFLDYTDQAITVTFNDAGAGTFTDGIDVAEFYEVEALSLTEQDDVVDASADTTGVQVDGGLGADSLTGGAGDDTFDGGGGDDRLEGGAGNDLLRGGSGDDTFIHETNAGSEVALSVSVGGSSRNGVNPQYEVYADGVLIFTGEVTWAQDGTAAFDPGAAGAFQSVEIPYSGAVPGSVEVRYINDYVAGDEESSGDRNLHLDSVRVGETTYEAETDATISGGGASGTDAYLWGTGSSATFDTSGATPVSSSDTMEGGDDADTFIVTQGFGNDQIIGGEGGTDTDTIDLSGVTGPVTVTYSGDEEGTITDGTNTINFSEVERLILTDHADVVDATADSSGTYIQAGDGNDTIEYGYGDSTVFGGDGDDYIDGEINGNGASADSLDGGAGNDTIWASDGDDTVAGGSGDDQLVGGGDNDIVDGGAGNDSLYGGAGRDTIKGGDGADWIDGGEGSDIILGDGLPQPIVLLDFEDGASATATDATGNGHNGTYQNGATTGGTGWDGNGTALVLDGTDDYVEIPDDPTFALDRGTVSVRFNADTIGDGDTLVSRDSTNFDGGGHLRVYLTASGSVGVRLQSDTASHITTTASGTVAPGEWHHVAVTFGDDGLTVFVDGVEAASDPYTGGLAGNTEPWTVGANQWQSGDAVADNLQNHFDGQVDEFAVYDAQFSPQQVAALHHDGASPTGGSPGDDTIIGGNGDDTIEGGDGADDIDGGSGNDLIRGGAGDDSINAGSSNDTVYGGSGNDTITSGNAGAARDEFYGGDGDDVITGGTGADSLTGGRDNDSLTGGDGDDTFGYDVGDGADTITDFNAGNSGALNDGDMSNNDFIDLSAFYDTLVDLRADFEDDGELNQSNSSDRAGTVDYSGKDRFGENEGITFENTDSKRAFTADNTNVVCFTGGTLIATPTGDMPVEHLRPGDLVLTRDNGPRPLVWVTSRSLGRGALSANPKLKPIWLSPHLVGARAPLLVSRQHAMVMSVDGDERLIRAVHLARMHGGKARIAHGCTRVRYFHLACERHEILFANGAASESFYPGPQAVAALSAAQQAELIGLFPDLAQGHAVSAVGATARVFSHWRDLPRAQRALVAP
ncbi:MAG: LamG-like jellyroll fold domain-containing protein [Pseudomonadota bacterium]